MRSFALLLLAAAGPAALQAADQQQAAAVAANPIRKVVTMLQAMQTKVAAEGEREKELYDKFMCYCKTSGGDLTESIAAAETKAPSVGANIKAAEEQKIQVDGDLKQHRVDRDAAKAAMQEASAIREKEAAAFAAEKASYTSDIQAIATAVNAIQKGMAGTFLQTGAAQVLRKLMMAKQDVLDIDRQAVMSFLSGEQRTGYVPRSGEITGILKGLGDDMAKNLAAATAEEDDAVKAYEDLMAAKRKEVEILGKSVETKTERIGELAVEIVQMKDDLSDTEEALLEDRKFLADLGSSCGTKTKEYEVNDQTRKEELVALAETIKILNDDDALDLFKKTLPSASASASFVQVEVGESLRRARALAAVREAQRKQPGSPDLDFIALAVQGKKVGFEKVIKMIDDMVANLAKEQQDDEHKKAYCAAQLDLADDKKKGLERSVSELELQIEDKKEGLATTKDAIAALEKGIKALDKSVAEATEQRKAEHEDFTALMSSNSAAKELIAMAKNRLNKFYNPKLYMPKADAAGAVLVQVSQHRHHKAAPPPPPETFGAYTKKSEEGTGVIAMLDLLVKDLDKEMTEAETMEEDAQKDYEQAMKDSAEKRARDTKSLAGKATAKAALETDMQAAADSKASTGKELGATLKYISSLHSECDWLMKYFDVRKEARASEVDSLKKAKAALAGADYALLAQTGMVARNLRGLA